MRIRLLVLFAIVTFQSGLAQSTFGDSVFNLVLQGKITAFDTLYTPVSKSRLFKRYLATDTVMTEFWMRPRFVDNVYLAFPWIFSDGQCFNRGFEFDTVTFGANTDYVAFYQETIHPLTGDYTGNEFGFLVNRNDKPLSSIEALERVRASAEKRNGNKEMANKLSTDNGSYWKNKAIKIHGKDYEFDSCQYLYQLQLFPDFSFKQSYSGDTICHTKEMRPNIVIGVEGDTGDYLKYKDEVQYCLIQNRIGAWLVDENQLIFLSRYGYEISRFTILECTYNQLELATSNGYSILLAREQLSQE